MAWGRMLVRDFTRMVFAVVAGSACVYAQVEAPNLSGRMATAARAERPPRLDGTLDDPIWQTTPPIHDLDRKSTRLNSSHVRISYAVFCLKKKKTHTSFCVNLK